MAQRPIMGHGLFILDFLDNKQRSSTVGRTPLDEWSARRTDLYLTRPNTHNFSRRATADPRLKLRGHWDRRKKNLMTIPEGLGENCCPPSGQSKNTALNLEAINSPEMSVTIHQSTRCCIPEGLCIQYIKILQGAEALWYGTKHLTA
jgi:hypothetical protein